MKQGILFIFLFPAVLVAQQKDAVAIRYSELIKSDVMSKYLHILASDEFEGRETGKRGQKMAAVYIAGQFKANGIPSFKADTYYQPFFF